MLGDSNHYKPEGRNGSNQKLNVQRMTLPREKKSTQNQEHKSNLITDHSQKKENNDVHGLI